MKNGYFIVTEEPGLGIDINEKEAAKYPIRLMEWARYARVMARSSSLNMSQWKSEAQQTSFTNIYKK